MLPSSSKHIGLNKTNRFHVIITKIYIVSILLLIDSESSSLLTNIKIRSSSINQDKRLRWTLKEFK
ncbi:hypothetical protein HanXRQr2_Chr03g0129471 [Helianthus annuus]|uniref:Uncharacterized protein n=1 Tax=Helianthus annuus TaxID=4232 RepID=A0A251V9F2_HELAN|nr:hypothetical protein HanXRQr2_Chr03g0129471 [Helianthus annuus]